MDREKDSPQPADVPMGRTLKPRGEVAVPGKRKRGRPRGSGKRPKTEKTSWEKIDDTEMKEDDERKRLPAQRPG
eukprot:3530443-Heterocapsa_arctica.AAC.1